MTWAATDRYGIEPAPGTLGLPQDLLNTVSAGLPDLLDDLPQAQAWVDAATAEWSAATGQPAPEVVLDADALQELRAFRHELQDLTARAGAPDADAGSGSSAGSGGVVAVAHSAAALSLGEDGRVRLEARGTGWRRLVSLTLAAIHQAQLTDSRRRLKVCRNPRCRCAFYDRSRNNSGVWHDVKRCGNAANLRAYRARQRAQA